MGGVIGCGVGPMRATRSNTAAHISTSFASVRTRLMNSVVCWIFEASEMICKVRWSKSFRRGSLFFRERMT